MVTGHSVLYQFQLSICLSSAICCSCQLNYLLLKFSCCKKYVKSVKNIISEWGLKVTMSKLIHLCPCEVQTHCVLLPLPLSVNLLGEVFWDKLLTVIPAPGRCTTLHRLLRSCWLFSWSWMNYSYVIKRWLKCTVALSPCCTLQHRTQSLFSSLFRLLRIRSCDCSVPLHLYKMWNVSNLIKSQKQRQFNWP